MPTTPSTMMSMLRVSDARELGRPDTVHTMTWWGVGMVTPVQGPGPLMDTSTTLGSVPNEEPVIVTVPPLRGGLVHEAM